MAGRPELASGLGEPCGWVAEQRSEGMREGGRGGGGGRREEGKSLAHARGTCENEQASKGPGATQTHLHICK